MAAPRGADGSYTAPSRGVHMKMGAQAKRTSSTNDASAISIPAISG